MDGQVHALGREPAGGKFSGMMCACMSTIIGRLGHRLQSEVGAVQGLTTAPQTAQPAAPGQTGGFEVTGYEVLATMRLSTYVPLVVRSGVSSVLEGEPVASSAAPAEVPDES
jgi:hypothetical protein